jgi:hypothetical protein
MSEEFHLRQRDLKIFENLALQLLAVLNEQRNTTCTGREKSAPTVSALNEARDELFPSPR